MARLAFALLALCCLALPCVAEDLCLTYRETRLVIDRSLNEEAFSLREMSSAKLERIVGLGGDREILHRTYAMSLESANGIAVFKGEWGGTCYISRDIEQSKPISLPVFFIGQAGQTREDLEERIGRTKFASSLSLTPKQNFSEVNFLLSRGEWVGKVQAFFRCGLPGLLVCAETCPRESDPLVAALVNSVARSRNFTVKGKRLDTKMAQAKPETSQPQPKPVTSQPKQETSKPAPRTETTPAPTPVTPPPPPVVIDTSPAPKPDQPPVPAPKPDQPSVAVPVPETTKPDATQPPPSTEKKLVLTFQTVNGASLAAADVLDAEGKVVVEGVTMQATDEGLTARLPEDALTRASSPQNLKSLFLRHRVTAITLNTANILLTLEPGYIKANDLKVRVVDPRGMPVADCNLRIDVPATAQAGSAWNAVPLVDGRRTLSLGRNADWYSFAFSGIIPLIVKGKGDPGILLMNLDDRCPLENRSAVTEAELRNGLAIRTTRSSGAVLIAIGTTDGDFSAQMPNVPSVFWTKALALTDTVARLEWKKIAFALAERPGIDSSISELPGVLDGPEPARNEKRTAAVKTFVQASTTSSVALKSEPLEAINLTQALSVIRRNGGIDPRESIGQETLLVVTGGVKKQSGLCDALENPATTSKSATWLMPIRRAFIVEIWDDALAQALDSARRTTKPVSAPVGVSLCQGKGAAANVQIYAIVAKTLQDETARNAAFSFLIQEASIRLKP